MSQPSQLFSSFMIKEKIRVPGAIATCRNYSQHIERELKKRLERKCSRHGYLKSVSLHKMTPGEVDMSSLDGSVIYLVILHAQVCTAANGSLYDGIVANTNRFGFLVLIGDGSDVLIEMVVPRVSLMIKAEDGVDMDKVNIGDMVRVKVMGRKFSMNDTRIAAVGKIMFVHSGSQGDIAKRAVAAITNTGIFDDEQYNDEENNSEVFSGSEEVLSDDSADESINAIHSVPNSDDEGIEDDIENNDSFSVVEEDAEVDLDDDVINSQNESDTDL